MLVADFHIHTSVSKDSYLSPKALPLLLKKLNYNVAGIVDHNSNKGAMIAKKYAPTNFLVLVGQEIKTQQGEIIVFGAERILRGSIWEILEIAKDENFLTVLPHPFDILRKSSSARRTGNKEIKKIIEKVDALETFNSRCTLSIFNSRAKLLAKLMKKPIVAGSDAHTLSELGKAKTLVHAELNEDNIFEAVRKGGTEIQGRLSSWLVHAKSAFARLEKIFSAEKRKVAEWKL